ncbi:hypothetical protein T440DRAFT_243818 [Plenodomus tracheiphilus IPT5]|uniref:Uncharacterized protein n=1 Tax=Plenodomus tracheiphilus IPT5 TaxID=1408161 RepID=A0A6A7BHT4_9PLEO|nr:hypothetical protein T440DRAFT_243818 [Plenodomus tracheiphilus IPT5]
MSDDENLMKTFPPNLRCVGHGIYLWNDAFPVPTYVVVSVPHAPYIQCIVPSSPSHRPKSVNATTQHATPFPLHNLVDRRLALLRTSFVETLEEEAGHDVHVCTSQIRMLGYDIAIQISVVPCHVQHHFVGSCDSGVQQCALVQRVEEARGEGAGVFGLQLFLRYVRIAVRWFAGGWLCEWSFEARLLVDWREVPM